MATAVFGPVLESALKQDTQGGTLTMQRNHIIYPRFFCCVSGTTVGVDKEPVARKISSVTRVCTNTAVCIDFSKSWSPSSTIASWSVDWGDGNISNGVWPGPGVVCHPLGGYALPGVYTVVLTVIDLLGATGTDTQEIEAIDCSELELELFAGCGSSGIWRSLNAGVSWENVSTETLLDTEIYDLKVHPFTIGTDHLELWAATEKGLYKTIDAAGSWGRITLPEPETGLGEPGMASIVCSTVEPLEIYVLTHLPILERAWLYRTVDGGITWTWIEIGTSTPATSQVLELRNTERIIGYVNANGGAGGGYGHGGHRFCVWDGLLHFDGGRSWQGGLLTRAWRRNADETWTDIGSGVGGGNCGSVNIAASIDLWQVGYYCSAGQVSIAYWDGAWHDAMVGGSTYGRPHGMDVIVRSNSNIAVFRGGVHADNPCEITHIANDGTYIETWSFWTPDPYPGWYYRMAHCIGEHAGTVLVGIDNYGVPGYGDFYRHTITRHPGLGVDPVIEWTSPTQCPKQLINYGSSIYAVITNSTNLLKRVVTAWVVDAATAPGNIRFAWLHAGSLYISCGNSIYKHVGTGYSLIGTFPYPVYWIAYHDGRWFGLCHNGSDLPENGIYELTGTEGGSVLIPSVGRTHLLSMDSSGQYVYVGLLYASDSTPYMQRIPYDLVNPEIIEVFGAGTWAGVRCDYSHPERVWMFGDFGAVSKVLLSDDWGDTTTDVTDGTWAANELVRCILPSIYGYNNVIAILSTDQESWQSGDAGTTWAKTGDLPYGVHCGERDWIKEFNVFVGRVNAGAEHIRYSPNDGVHWYERSGGFEPNAPVTALQITA